EPPRPERPGEPGGPGRPPRPGAPGGPGGPARPGGPGGPGGPAGPGGPWGPYTFQASGGAAQPARTKSARVESRSARFIDSPSISLPVEGAPLYAASLDSTPKSRAGPGPIPPCWGNPPKVIHSIKVYLPRPAGAQDRLRLLDDGRIMLTLRSAWADGTRRL